jgi:hypothetical protein
MPELEIKEMPNGCYGLGEKITDFIMTEWLLDKMPTLYQQDEIIYQYNQFNQKRSQKSCTLFSPIWAVSDLWNIEIDLWEIKEWDEESYNKGRAKDSGWLVSRWVEHICDCWNASKHWKELWKVAFYSFVLKDNALLQKIFSKRYTACIGYQWNSTYNADKNKDWILNETKFWSYTYWHAVNTIRWINTPARIKDNYFWTKYNIYDIEHEYKDIPCFYERWYIITKVKEDNLERVKELNVFRTNAILTIEKLWEMRHQTTVQSFRDDLHNMANKLRSKVNDIDEQLILLS